MALGATAGEVIWLVLWQSLRMILLGVGVGTAVALAAGRVLERLVDGIEPAGLRQARWLARQTGMPGRASVPVRQQSAAARMAFWPVRSSIVTGICISF
ncbi:MAG: hypothetical protein WB579_02615, partial [Bryobacteraceae bacterium]